MCGIIGYIGENACASTLVEGLHRLEYRGYDSAGVATVEKAQEVSRLQVCKAEGKVVAVEQALLGCRLQGTVGIGHTRWATHGTPTAINAHPHCSADNTVAVVHNGIIENFESLRKWLQAEGYLFASDTDTEVLPHLIERELALH
jgi:glucosamine--fructose-6-phosphate aminotransferase (isomerizing)